MRGDYNDRYESWRRFVWRQKQRRTNKSSVSSDRRSSEDRRKVDINEVKKDKE